MTAPEKKPNAPPLTIPGWPVVAPGLLMTTVDTVVFMHLGGGMPDASYELYLRALEKSLSHRERGARVAVIYDIPAFSGLRAIGARAAGQIFLDHRDTLAETTACFALVSPSTLARIAAQTVLAMSRLPFPQRTLPTLGSALAFVSTVLPGMDPVSVERRIAAEMAKHGRWLGR